MSDQINNADVQARIKEMAKLALLSGRISEFHEKNLKAYPFVFFNDVESAEIEYDLTQKEDSFVAFKLKIKDFTNSHIEKRFSAIQNATRSLFWNNLAVRVYVNDILMFGDTNGRK